MDLASKVWCEETEPRADSGPVAAGAGPRLAGSEVPGMFAGLWPLGCGLCALVLQWEPEARGTEGRWAGRPWGRQGPRALGMW